MKTLKGRLLTTDAEIDAALARAKAHVDTRPHAVAARYVESSDVVEVTLQSGVKCSFPRRLLQGLENADPKELRRVEVLGTGLRWERLDVDHYVPALVDGVFGNRRWMSEIGTKGGAVRSEAKATAARANGKKGGRPKRETKPA